MNWIDWLIVLVPFSAVMALAVHARRYARDVVDFLAAGRCAGRYVISVGDVAAGLSVIILVAHCETTYKVGTAMEFWNLLMMPIGMALALTGYCAYRWRATRALSFGQFLEQRYGRSLRVFCAALRNISEMTTNSIGPAVAAHFFIYFLGFPHKFHVLGAEVPTFAFIVGVCLCLALLAIWPAGRISLLVTDTAQGILSYPIFVIVGCWIFFRFSWGTTMEPVMMNRVSGESFLNPFDVEKMRDFNLFALGVTIMGIVLQRASWFGNDTSNAGRTPHEQKMAGVLGTWRNGFSSTMIWLTALLVITVMNHESFVLPGTHGSFSSHGTRVALVNKVVAETVDNPDVRAQIAADLAAMEPRLLDEPLSQLKNNDTPYIDAARDRINANVPDALSAEAEAVRAGLRDPSPELATIQGENARQAQRVRTLYGQMMLPVTLRGLLPPSIVGLFALLMLMLLVSTDDSRIFNAASTWVQDVVLPLFRRPPSNRLHMSMLRWASVAVAAFFFVFAVFFAQLDYIAMFFQITAAVWLGGGGTVMVFGLYSRFGNVVGAWCSVVFGCGFSVLGFVLQRTWAAHVVPLLSAHGWAEGFFRFFARLSRPLNPWVDWSFGFNSGESTFEQALQLFREKFFMNSTEIYGIAMVLSLAAYCLGSWIALKAGWCGMFDLDRLLHRGRYADASPTAIDSSRLQSTAIGCNRKPSILSRLVGIDEEYTRGDKVIAWSVFLYSIVYQFGFAFLAVILWNMARPWPKAWWGKYYYVTGLLVPIIVGCVSTVWFLWGGIRDGIRLFRDLDRRITDADDNGYVPR